MKTDNLGHKRIVCVLGMAGDAVVQGRLTEDEFHLLLGLYAIAGHTYDIEAVSERGLSKFLSRAGVRRRITLSDGVPAGVEAVGKALRSLRDKGWISLNEYDSRPCVYDIGLFYDCCPGCASMREVDEL